MLRLTTFIKTRWLSALVLVLSAMLGSTSTLADTSNAAASALKPVGKILFATNDSYLQRGSRTVLQRKTLLQAGDTIVTGAKGRVQILMADGTKIALHPNSAMRLDAFQFDKSNTKAANTASNTVVTNNRQNGRSIYRLLKGGFRTITGKIGKVNPKGYEVKTPVATIGVRGTHYSVLLCANDCVNNDGSAAQNGLYVGVSNGAITVDNGRGEVQINNDQYAYVGGRAVLPTQLTEAPIALLNMGNRQAAARTSERRKKNSEANKKQQAANTDSATNQRGDAVDTADIGEPAEPRFAVAASGLAIDATRAHHNTADQLSTMNGNITRFSADGTEYELTGGNMAETGQTLDLRWGRWAESGTGAAAMQSTNANGSSESHQLSSRNLHWITSNLPSDTLLPKAGQVGYTLIDSTSPTNNLGDSGVVGSAILNADFNREIVETNIELNINAREWEASGIGEMGGQHGYGFGGDFDDVTISGSGGVTESGSGEFAGVFGTPDSTGVPIGAGMAYEMSDADESEVINGVVIFGPEPQDQVTQLPD